MTQKIKVEQVTAKTNIGTIVIDKSGMFYSPATIKEKLKTITKKLKDVLA